MNKRVGIAIMNFEGREPFAAGVASIMLDIVLLTAMAKHLWQQMDDGLGFFLRHFHGKVFEAFLPEVLKLMRASKVNGTKLAHFKPRSAKNRSYVHQF